MAEDEDADSGIVSDADVGAKDDAGADTGDAARDGSTDATAGDSADGEDGEGSSDAGDRSLNWQELEQYGDDIASIGLFAGVTYASTSVEDDGNTYRSTDGGLTWQPAKSSGFDAVVAKSNGNPSHIDYTESSSEAYAVVRGKLYSSGGGGWMSDVHDLPRRMFKVVAAGDLLVGLETKVDDMGRPTYLLRVSENGGDDWRQERVYQKTPALRAWNSTVFVRVGDSLDRWNLGDETWSNHSLAGKPPLSAWHRVGERFAALTSRDVWTSDDGVDWTKSSLADEVPTDWEKQVPVTAVDADASGLLAAVTRSGRVGTIDEQGSWEEWTQAGPSVSGGSLVVTQQGFLSLAGQLPFLWSSADRSWSLIDVSGGHARPDEVVVTSDGLVVSRNSGEAFVVSDGAADWQWQTDGSVGDVTKLFSRDGRIIGFADTGCLLEWSQEGLEVIDGGNGSTECLDELPWDKWSTMTDVASLEGELYIGFSGERNPQGHDLEDEWEGGGLYRWPDDGSGLSVVGATGLPARARQPWFWHLASRGDALLAIVDGEASRVFARRDADAAGWTVHDEGVSTPDGAQEMHPKFEGLEVIGGEIFSQAKVGGNEPFVARRTQTGWVTLEEQPPGELRAVDSDDMRLFAGTSQGLFVRGAAGWSRVSDVLPGEPVVSLDAHPTAIAVSFADGSTWRGMSEQ